MSVNAIAVERLRDASKHYRAILSRDIPEGVELKCITQHPGFQPVCLEKWSLRLAAWKYKTKGKQRYRQSGNEER